MDRELKFIVPIPEVLVRERISEFLGRSGYKTVEAGQQTFIRGFSKIGTMFAFSPKDWGAKVHVRTSAINDQETEVNAVFSIETFGQWITDKERAFWQSEFEGFKSAVSTEKIDVSSSDQLAEATNLQNWLSVVVIYLLSTFSLLCSALIALLLAQSIVDWLAILCIGGAVGTLTALSITKFWLKYKLNGKW
jgi:hypothetical protein